MAIQGPYGSEESAAATALGTFPVEEAADAFGRARVSNPTTIFDSKLNDDAAPLFWDELLESGAGITATYDITQSAVDIESTASTAGKFTRSTFQRFNYQPGKGQLILMTGNLALSGLSSPGDGVARRLGNFNDDDGLCFEEFEGEVYVVIRSSVGGAPSEQRVVQSAWNVDKFDGSGPSVVTVDWTKSQIFVIDFEWLGVGRVRFGLVQNGRIFYAHNFRNENSLPGVYMRTPNLPLRYQMETTASSPAHSMRCICTTVISEGGVINLDVTSRATTPVANPLQANVAAETYAMIGIRLKSTHFDTIVRLVRISALAVTNDDYEWEVRLNPTVAVPLVWNGVPDRAIEIAFGQTANTVTGGLVVDGEWVQRQTRVVASFTPARYIGAAIDGTPDEAILCIRPRTAGLDVHGSITWREST